MGKEINLEHMDVGEITAERIPKVEELLQILIETNQQQGAQSVAFMLDFMDSMEGQLDSVKQELQAVRKELNDQQNRRGLPNVKEQLTNLITGLERKVTLLQKQIKDLKEVLNERAGQIVDNFKKQGVRALANVTEILGVKGMYLAIQASFENQLIKVDQNISKINELEQKCRESVMYIKNAGKVIMGKDIQKEVVYPEKSFFANMRKPYQSMKNLYVLGMTESKRAVVKLEQLEKAGKQIPKSKGSIVDKLKKFKGNQVKTDKEQVVGQKGKGQEYGR